MPQKWNLLEVRLRQIASSLAELRRDLQSQGINLSRPSKELLSKEVFIEAGKVHDAYKEVRDLISGAASEVWIEDNYVDNSLFDLLSNLPPNVEVKVLTKKWPRDFPLELKKFREQYGVKMEVRTSVNFHDRFIWVDDRCYHLGASIKDAGKKAFMLSQLEDPNNVQAVRGNLENAWQSGTLIEPFADRPVAP